MLALFLLASAILALSLLLLCVNIILRRSSFRSLDVGQSEAMRSRGVHCTLAQDALARAGKAQRKAKAASQTLTTPTTHIMNKTLTAILPALLVLALASCSGKQQQDAEAGEQAQAPQEGATLRIAYVETDSLMANYQLCKDYTEIGNMEAENIKNTLASKQRALEQHYSEMQKKYESNGFTSQEELSRAQASLQKEQQDLEELSARLSNSFSEQQLKYNEIMRDSIQNFLASYNKTKKYDLILAKAGDNLLYANARFDITEEVLRGLNKRYKPSAEVQEKLKPTK